jgi:hypothetical protein
MYINDSIYLQSTLVPDTDEDLRATAGFIDGQKFYFAAYKLNGIQEGATAVYTYSTVTNKWTPDGAPLGVVPDNSTVYRFVAYSYFGSTDEPTTSIDFSKDLVWGSIETAIDDTEASRTLNINMLHKLARVKVRVKSGITGVTVTDLTGVEVEGGSQATLNPFDGSFSFGNPVTQEVEFNKSTLPNAQIESAYRVILPVLSAPARVKFATVKISAVVAAFANQTVSFRSTLDAGTSYILVVDLKKCVWARSNIYWDATLNNGEGALTFVPAGFDTSKEGYQGVFFKWGSLVGISPAQTGGSNNFSTSTPVYIPTYNKTTYSSSTWVMDDDHSYTSWPQTASGVAENDAANIPYMDGNCGYDSNSTFSSYLTDAARNTDAMYEARRGDICKYLNKTGVVSGNYRMPKSYEIKISDGNWNTSTPSSDGWLKGTATWPNWQTDDNRAAGDPDGRADLLDPEKNHVDKVLGSGINPSKGNLVFPASGYRSSSSLNGVGGYGYYWSCSSYDAVRGFATYLQDDRMVGGWYNYRSFAYSVRCVRD